MTLAAAVLYCVLRSPRTQVYAPNPEGVSSIRGMVGCVVKQQLGNIALKIKTATFTV